MAEQNIVPMSLSDIFDRLFKLIGKTWLRSLVLTFVILVVPVVIMSAGLQEFFSSIATFAKENEPGSQLPPQQLLMMLGSMGWFFFGLIVFVLGTATARLGVTIIACAETTGQPMTWQEALKRAFSIRLVRMFGAFILQGLIFAGLFIPFYVLLIIAIAARSAMLGVVSGLSLVACVFFLVFLIIRWAFIVPAIAWEDHHVVNSFRRSWALVKDNWWRVFGILLLLGIMLSFAVSLVMTPVYIITLWKFIAGYFEMIASAGSHELDPTPLLEGLRSLGFAFGLVSGLSTLLQMLVAPLYVVVVYFDLRARKNEFGSEPSSSMQPAM